MPGPIASIDGGGTGRCAPIARRGLVARDFRNQGAPVDALLLESYGRLCDLLLCPAPDLRAVGKIGVKRRA